MKILSPVTCIFKSLFSRTGLLCSVLLVAAPLQIARAQGPPPLGTAQSFAVLGGSTVTNTGPSVIVGDLGVSPGTAITGFPPGTLVGGSTHAADAVALQAQNDNTTAYNALAGLACNTTFGVPTDIGGLTLVPGVYCFSSSAQLTGILTLDAGGDPSAAWVFQIASTLVTASNSSVLLINGAQQCNVSWQVGSSATIGTGTQFVGNILALASISLTTNATLAGRALAQTGAVTMDTNTITVSACTVPTLVPPTLNKSFSPASITAGGISTITIDLNNANATAASLTAPLTDTLPAGLVVSGNATTTCGGTVSAPAGGSTITLTGGAIPANGSCIVTVDVTTPSAGNYINSLATGALQTSNGNSTVPAAATLTVTPVAAVAPTLNKSFTPASIMAGGTTSLVLSLSNQNSVEADLTAPLIDTLPSGVTVSGAPSTTCGGSVTAPSGGSTVTLTGGSIPANGSCTVTVDVTAPGSGSFFNSMAAGALQTSNGNNTAPAVATLVVTPIPAVPPTLSKSFSPISVTAGGSSTLTISLSNPNLSIATLTAPLVDMLPSGLTVAGSASNTCGGTVTAPIGGSTVTLTGGAIPADSSCTVTVMVTGKTAGSYLNTLAIGALQTSNGNNLAPAIATLTITAIPIVPPTVSKSFNPSTVNIGANSLLTITLNNPSGVAAKLSAPFTDNFPSGVVVSGSASTTCGGSVTAPIGGSKVTLTGGSIPALGSCTVTVIVTAAKSCSKGGRVNTIPAGALQTCNGKNSAPASATLMVNIPPPPPAPPTLGKSFYPASIYSGGSSVLTISLSNPSSTVAKLSAPLTDNFPSGVVVSGSASTTCGGSVAAAIGGSKVTLTGGSIPANGSCTVKVTVTTAKTCSSGGRVNTLPAGALQTSNGANKAAAVATLTVTKK
jgi:hypothetical protein